MIPTGQGLRLEPSGYLLKGLRIDDFRFDAEGVPHYILHRDTRATPRRIEEADPPEYPIHDVGRYLEMMAAGRWGYRVRNLEGEALLSYAGLSMRTFIGGKTMKATAPKRINVPVIQMTEPHIIGKRRRHAAFTSRPPMSRRAETAQAFCPNHKQGSRAQDRGGLPAGQTAPRAGTRTDQEGAKSVSGYSCRRQVNQIES